MSAQLFISIGIIFAAFAFWVLIQESARRFARRHPEFGPAREEGGECGISCGCPNWKTCRDRGQRVEGRGQGSEEGRGRRVEGSMMEEGRGQASEEGRGVSAGSERERLANFQGPDFKPGIRKNENDNNGT